VFWSDTMKKRTAVVTILALAIAAWSDERVAAWELDVHYLLTFWLATRAGFSRRDASEIAAGDQSYDDSNYHAAIFTMSIIALTGDTGAARSLQVKHFPSDAALPGPPQRRLVTPNSVSARLALEAATRPTSSAQALRALGEALHPFQDSWSHQGVPDVPLGIRPDVSCAHPVARGGWRSHDADLSHLHVAEVVDLARQTCAGLQQFLVNNPSYRAAGAPGCGDIDGIVNEFARASTQRDKDEWAVKYTAEERVPDQLAMLTLPRLTTTDAREATVVRGAMRPGPRPPEGLIAAAQRFLETWVEKFDIAQAVDSVSWKDLGRQFADDPRFGASRDKLIPWCKKFMTMYLVNDHAAVNAAGHGDPRAERYATLPESPQSGGTFRARSFVTPPRLGPADFVPMAATGGRATFGLIVQLPNQPYDGVGLVWQQVDGVWKIVRMISFIA
jgi:hypothetical protein